MLGKPALESAISALDATSGRIDFWLLIFTIIVAVGVAGEAFFGVWHLVVANRLAPLRVSLAAIEAKELEGVRTIGAQASERAARAELETAQLKAKAAPRTLSDEQRDTLTAELRGKIPRINLVVQRDPETEWYAVQIGIALQESGAIMGHARMPPGEALVVGAGLVMYSPKIRSAESRKLAGDPLYEALVKAGLFGGAASGPPTTDLTSGGGTPLPPDQYALWVGQKPP